MKNKFELKNLIAFVWTALAWLVLSELLICFFSSSAVNIFWFLVTWALSTFNLYALGRVGFLIAHQLGDAKSQDGGESDDSSLQIILWAFLKLASLGGLGVLLYLAKDIEQFPVLLGIGTLFIVPLVGGYWWNSRELRYA